MPSNAEYIAIEQKYYAQTVRRRPVVIVRGEWLPSVGRRRQGIFDFVAGWAVDNPGPLPARGGGPSRSRPPLSSRRPTSFIRCHSWKSELLIENSCMDRVFFCNSGAEAVEGALKIARRYGKLHKRSLRGHYRAELFPRAHDERRGRYRAA